MEFFIYCYGDMETLRGLFEGVVRITRINSPFGSPFATILKVTALIGFFSMMVYGLLTPGRFPVLSWFAGFVLVYGLLFVPTAKVWFLDNTREGASASGGSVDHVPFGLAILASLTSQIGHEMTKLFETGMQSVNLPETLKYGQHGLIPGNRIVTQARKANIKTPQLYSDMMNFLYNCTMYDIADGTIDANTLRNEQTNIWGLLGPENSKTNPSRYSPIGQSGDLKTCPDAYKDINTRLTNEVPLARAEMMKKMNPDLTLAEADMFFNEQFRDAMITSRLGDASSDVTNMLRQNMMINIIGQSSQVIGQKMADPATVMYSSAVSQATAATNMSYQVQAAMAAQAMPMIRNAIEAVAYALFPFVILVCFVSTSSGMLMAIKSYVMTLVWVQLWPPIYAVLNYVATLSCGYAIGSAGGFASGETGGLSLANANSIYGTGISNEAVVGYMTVLVPVIASAIVYGGGKAASIGVASMVSSSGRAAEGAASGNTSMGVQNIDQHNLAASRSDPTLSTKRDAFGETSLGIGKYGVEVGSVRHKESMSNFATKIALSAKDADQYTHRATDSKKMAEEQSQSAINSYAAAIMKAHDYSHKHTKAGGSQSASGTGEQGSDGKQWSDFNSKADAINDALGLEKGNRIGFDKAAQAYASAALGGSYLIGKAEAGAMASSGANVKSDEGISKANSILSSISGSKGAGSAGSYMQTAMSMTMSLARSEDAREASTGISESLAESQKFEKASKESFEHAQKDEQIAAAITEASKMTTTDLANALTPYMDVDAYNHARDGDKQAMVVAAATAAMEHGGFGINGHVPYGDGDHPYATPGSVVGGPTKEKFDARAPVGGGRGGVDQADAGYQGQVTAKEKEQGINVDDSKPKAGGKAKPSAARVALDGFKAKGDQEAAAAAAATAAASKAANEHLATEGTRIKNTGITKQVGDGLSSLVGGDDDKPASPPPSPVDSGATGASGTDSSGAGGGGGGSGGAGGAGGGGR
jgi:conjugal transfer mating pair stabilization protein TraG